MIINRSFIYIQFHLEKITLQEQVSYLDNNQFTKARNRNNSNKTISKSKISKQLTQSYQNNTITK